MGKFTKILVLLPMLLALNACGNMEYLDRSSYSELKGNDSNIRIKKYSDGYKPAREYGALVIAKDLQNTENLDAEEKNYYLALKRIKHKVFAEAVLYDNKNTHSGWIDQTAFDFGVDKKNKSFNIGLTLKY